MGVDPQNLAAQRCIPQLQQAGSGMREGAKLQSRGLFHVLQKGLFFLDRRLAAVLDRLERFIILAALWPIAPRSKA